MNETMFKVRCPACLAIHVFLQGDKIPDSITCYSCGTVYVKDETEEPAITLSEARVLQQH